MHCCSRGLGVTSCRPTQTTGLARDPKQAHMALTAHGVSSTNGALPEQEVLVLTGMKHHGYTVSSTTHTQCYHCSNYYHPDLHARALALSTVEHVHQCVMYAHYEQLVHYTVHGQPAVCKCKPDRRL